MSQNPTPRLRRSLWRPWLLVSGGILVAALLAAVATGKFAASSEADDAVVSGGPSAGAPSSKLSAHLDPPPTAAPSPPPARPLPAKLSPRQNVDTSGYSLVIPRQPWPPNASLAEIREHWDRYLVDVGKNLDAQLAAQRDRPESLVPVLGTKAAYLISFGKPEEALQRLAEARQAIERSGKNLNMLASVIFFQGVAALRLGENENCVLCRGESSCILPIDAAAVHQFPQGSRLAIQYFTELLEHFPDDLEVRWLLNLAHMTLGEHPDKVDRRYFLSLDKYLQSEVDIGKFRDIGHLVGVNRFNQSGGAIMDDFDNDGLLDLVVTAFDPKQRTGFYRNTGKGKFVELSEEAGFAGQLGGMVCVQGDYNNDGLLDVYIPRGAWLPHPVRPSLLRNDGGCRFTDVTAEAGLLHPLNSNAAQWADFDNDGWLDLFVCCEQPPHRLYRNLGNGKFADVALQAGVAVHSHKFGKGCTWLDYDNDDFPDLFVNYLDGSAQLLHNNRDGTFTNVTGRMGVNGPVKGFSCWSWDYNNDGWLDIFATSYDFTPQDVIRGLLGESHESESNRLYLNQQGKGFRDVTREVGLDLVFAAMGSNFGDFDNDGFLDFYLGTGEPPVGTLVPNRMFKNLAGRRFTEITASAGVGHLQKGHAVACGDWDRDGNVDIFMQMGGAVDGDKYHNILFQNPGHDHSWMTVKLIGKQTNRSAIGARIKIVTDADEPLMIERQVCSGSSFGGNPLEQTIGLAGTQRIKTLEVHWPTSGSTQVFRDLDVNQYLEITEFADDVRQVAMQPVPLVEE